MANGAEFIFKGINWLGAEETNHAPLGLHKHKISWYMAFLRSHSFNAVRLSFDHEALLQQKLPSIPTDRSADSASAEQFDPEPGVVGRSYLQLLVLIAEEASRYGLLLILAERSPRANQQLAWFEGTPSISDAQRSWSILAEALCDSWNVVGVDVFNEPHASTWGGGGGDALSWRQGAAALGNHVLGACPRWIIMVQGVGSDAAGWGSSLEGAEAEPVGLSDPSRLVYAPHFDGDPPPSAWEQLGRM